MPSIFLNVGRPLRVYICADFLIRFCPTAMFLRGVLDKILTMPDLAGISRNRTKPSIVIESQALPSNGSCLLQQKKRKVQPNLGEMNRLIFASLKAIAIRFVRGIRASKQWKTFVVLEIYTIIYIWEHSSLNATPKEVYWIWLKDCWQDFLVEDDDIFPYWENTSRYRRDDYSMDIDADEIDCQKSRKTVTEASN